MQSITGQTNACSSRFGAGAVDGIGKDLGSFIVTILHVPWRLARPRVGVQAVGVLLAENTELETLDRQVDAALDALRL